MESLLVSDYMNNRPVKLHIDMPVAEAVELLVQSKQIGGAVVDSHMKVVGFLSEQDCLAQMITSSYYREQVCRVADIMKSEVLSVKPYSSVLNLAQQMLKAKPKVYPVVDDDGILVGSINRTEVLNAIDVQLRSGYSAKAS
ncbi:CBS domain-containing protein [Alteromonas oceanisediminis]|uniref:CBS domain-containing protein n=1 Tax=Alteromonas oceanisediminis TaxID=2836180 RepID=UPI001BDB554A|nr:CBS domain-containing protein [Alteromonas oceanisediminis]MBT0587228.1 CBS domain-containing protein [Alteromonas oceanisediminis]